MPKKSTSRIRVAIVIGTRPEIIKMSPVIKEALLSPKIRLFVIHTGQHYSYEMDKKMFLDLNLPPPDVNLNVGSGSHAQMTAKMLVEIEKVYLQFHPDVVLVQGDTNSVLAGALVASKMGIKVGHIEAGLRSNDRTMPEEINRVLTDCLSDYLFAPTTKSHVTLHKESIHFGAVSLVGNTIVDSVMQNYAIANKKSTILKDQRLEHKNFLLLTVHRPSNTDAKAALLNILQAISEVAKKDFVFWPMHPRTEAKLKEHKLWAAVKAVKNVSIGLPVGFLDNLVLQSSAKIVITDSGGMQEEACILGTPSVTLRDNTERPETIDVGASKLVGIDKNSILEAVEEALMKSKNNHTWGNPFGDGTAARQIIATLTA